MRSSDERTHDGVGGRRLLLPQVGGRQALDAEHLGRSQQRGQGAVGHLTSTGRPS